MISTIFPDINVWLALSYTNHAHHSIAWEWYGSLRPGDDLVFCRLTQLGLLRLLTTQSVMMDKTMTQREAWIYYDRWLTEGGVSFVDEPIELEAEFRLLTSQRQSSPKEWNDSYLAAFAFVGSLELVTFDRALHQRARGSVLLTPSN